MDDIFFTVVLLYRIWAQRWIVILLNHHSSSPFRACYFGGVWDNYIEASPSSFVSFRSFSFVVVVVVASLCLFNIFVLLLRLPVSVQYSNFCIFFFPIILFSCVKSLLYLSFRKVFLLMISYTSQKQKE